MLPELHETSTSPRSVETVLHMFPYPPTRQELHLGARDLIWEAPFGVLSVLVEDGGTTTFWASSASGRNFADLTYPPDTHPHQQVVGVLCAAFMLDF